LSCFLYLNTTNVIYTLGEFGKGIKIDSTNLTGEAAIRYKNRFEMTSYNEYVSDMISTRRRLPDYRDPG